MQTPVFCVCDEQALAGACNTHVAQTPFLLQAARFLYRALVWKQAFFKTTQEHRIELQTLGGMQRHQLHAVFPFVPLAFTCFQCGVGKKCG